MSNNANGATTVAGTILLAKLAGIDVMATGGIGGVHRDAENTFDISADLQELSKTDVTVVCAGPKSILDIGLTLEYLETMGVPIIGYNTNLLPTTGMTLPFLSYGGSSILASAITAGILLSLTRKNISFETLNQKIYENKNNE